MSVSRRTAGCGTRRQGHERSGGGQVPEPLLTEFLGPEIAVDPCGAF